MVQPSGNEVRTIQSNRVFVQFGSARPNVPNRYYGQDMNYAIVQGVTRAINGAVTPHYTGDPRTANKYRLVSRTTAAPPLSAFTLHMLEKRGTINRMFAQDCGFTAYVASGDCNDLSSFLGGWSDKIEVYPDAIIGSPNLGNRGDWEANGVIVDQVPGTAREIYEIGAMGFGSILDSDIAVEVVDTVYGDINRCGSCGSPNNGVQWRYMVQKHSGSNSATVIYQTVDVDGTQIAENVIAITGIGASADPVAIDVVGDKLVVVVNSENAYYYATINQATGVPGTFTKVTTGFVSSKAPNDILVYSAREIFFAGDGGYVYKSTDITAGVSVLAAGSPSTNSLKRIKGVDNTLVAAGATGTVIVSTNRGQSWTTMTAPSGDTVQGLDVRDQSRYWVCTDGGQLFYTLDGANTWVAKTLSDSPTNLTDVVFVNDEVGWVCGATVTPTGLLYATFDGGRDFTSNAASPRMYGVPSSGFQRANRMAVSNAGNTQVAANNLMVAGLGATTDGIWLQGSGVFF